jgi:hypothetical protein
MNNIFCKNWLLMKLFKENAQMAKKCLENSEQQEPIQRLLNYANVVVGQSVLTSEKQNLYYKTALWLCY